MAGIVSILHSALDTAPETVRCERSSADASPSNTSTIRERRRGKRASALKLAGLGAVLGAAFGAAMSVSCAQDICGNPDTRAAPAGAAFANENDAAMKRMMAAMHVKPSGNVDRDFVTMMIPHHQGAIDMAVAYLRYGSNEQLRRIAQEIIVEQQQEIAAMELALGQQPPAATAVPTQPQATDGALTGRLVSTPEHTTKHVPAK
jgi:hypothetical protein